MDVFISYRRDGAESLAQLLYSRLKDDGYSVFLDVESLRSGRFNEAIYDQIDDCDDFLLLLPPKGLDRCYDQNDWVRLEIERAIEKQKNIIPIMMRNFEFPSYLPDSLSGLPFYNGITADMAFFDAVIQKLEGMFRSKAIALFDYKLTNNNKFKIKTSFCKLKTNATAPFSFVAMENEINQMFLSGEDVQYDGDYCRFVLDYIRFTPELKDSLTIWYNNSKKTIDKIMTMGSLLHDENDKFYFFTNAILFVFGLIHVMPIESFGKAAALLVETFCYCLGIPKSCFEVLEDIFLKMDGLTSYNQFLLLAFDIWPNILHNKTTSYDYKETFSIYACLLFDFMIEAVQFSRETVFFSRSVSFEQKRTFFFAQKRILLGHYRWLTKNKIFLPESIQEKLYRYFL